MARPVTQEARRRDIVDAAIAVLGEDGDGRISIADVARRLELTPNAVRYYYRDSDALMWAVRERAERRFLTDRLSAITEADDPREQLVRAMESGLPTGPEDAEWRMTFRPVMTSRPTSELGQMIGEVLAEQAEVYEQVLARGVASGVFTPRQPLPDIARTLMVMEDYQGLRIVMLDPTFSRQEALQLMCGYASLATGADVSPPS